MDFFINNHNGDFRFFALPIVELFDCGFKLRNFHIDDLVSHCIGHTIPVDDKVRRKLVVMLAGKALDCI